MPASSSARNVATAWLRTRAVISGGNVGRDLPAGAVGIDVLGVVRIEAVLVVDDDLAGDRRLRIVVARAPRIRSRARRPPRSTSTLRIEGQRRAHRALEIAGAGDARSRRPTSLRSPASRTGDNRDRAARAAPPRDRARNAAAVTTAKSTTGIPASRSRRLATSLSMPIAEPSTPGADVRDAGQLQQRPARSRPRRRSRAAPGTRRRRCRRRRRAAPAARGDQRLLHGDGGRAGVEHDRRADRPPPPRSVRSDSRCQRPACRCRPAPARTASRSSAGQHVARRQQRDLVLRRAAAEQDDDARLLHFVHRPADQSRARENTNDHSSTSWAITLPSGLPAPWPAWLSSRSSTGRAACAVRRLQARGHLARVHRIDARVGLGRVKQHGGVGDAVAHVVVRRVGAQPAERVRVVGRAVLGDPQRGDAEAVVAEHVEQRHAADDRAEQLRPLGQRGAHQQAAVRAPRDRQPRRRW